MPVSKVRAPGRMASLILLYAYTALAAGTSGNAPAPLEFSIRDGATLNTFYRQGPVAAHAVKLWPLEAKS